MTRPSIFCDMAMLYGYAEELPEIDESVVAQVISDSGLIGTAPALLSIQGSQPTPEVRYEAGAWQDSPGTQWQDTDREIVRQVFGMPGGKK